jgi:hypothetical protein
LIAPAPGLCSYLLLQRKEEKEINTGEKPKRQAHNYLLLEEKEIKFIKRQDLIQCKVIAVFTINLYPLGEYFLLFQAISFKQKRALNKKINKSKHKTQTLIFDCVFLSLLHERFLFAGKLGHQFLLAVESLLPPVKKKPRSSCCQFLLLN